MDSGAHEVNQTMENDLPDVPRETIIKVLAVIHFVAKRRTTGRREYMKIINDYVGGDVAPGLRVLRVFGN